VLTAFSKNRRIFEIFAITERRKKQIVGYSKKMASL